MRTRIETKSMNGREILTIEIGVMDFGENIVITKDYLVGGFDPAQALRPGYQPSPEVRGECSIDFKLDAETARALSFALAELAKTLGQQKC